MSKKLSGMLVLCVSALWLSGCAYFRATGPCFGVGCPAHSVGASGQYKPGQAPKAQTATAQRGSATSTQVTANAAVTPDPPSADAALAAPTSAQAKAADAKPSVAGRVGDFFAHLIPHHNTTAKTAAATD